MSILQDALLEVLLRYLVSDPMAKLPTMLSIVEKLDRHRTYEREISAVRKALTDEDMRLVLRFADSLFRGVDKHSLRKLVECLAINGSIAGGTCTIDRESVNINVPWAILMDRPAPATYHALDAGLRSTHTDNLDYETMDSICRQGKELGTHFYIFSGGEPLVRKDDILSLTRSIRTATSSPSQMEPS